MKSKKENSLKQLKNALKSFEAVMKQKKNDFIRDSAIKRFEFTFELMWKTLKVYLEDKGIKAYSPRDVLREAFQTGLISDDSKWIGMLETRNSTAHIYNEKMAERVYSTLKSYIPLFKKLVKDLG